MRDNKGRFIKGHKPFNKGRNLSEKHKKNLLGSHGNGGYVNTEGYKVKRINNKYLLEHHLVWCTQPENLSHVPKGFQIHHIDFNKQNNNPNNLFLLSISDHAKHHWAFEKKMNINRFGGGD